MKTFETKAAQYDWRRQTCGECGWAYIFASFGVQQFVCRRSNWNCEPSLWSVLSMPACPAFVPREVKP